MAIALPSRVRVAADTFALQMRRRRIIATIALVFLLEQVMVGFHLFQVWEMSDANAQGDVLRQVAVIATLGFLLLAPTNARPPMAVPTSILILLGYCLLSCTWAIDPAISLRRLSLTAAVIWILVRSIGDLGAVRTLNLLRYFLMGLLLVNYIMVVLSPYGRHLANDETSLVGDWRGITDHKNSAGAICAFTVLLFLFDRPRMEAWLRWGVLAASVLFLIMTQSKTSMGMLVLALVVGGLMQFYNPRHRSLLLPAGLVAAMLLFGLISMYTGAIENILDDPTALTGRGAIWPVLFDYAGEHLWTGAGYGSFWQIGPESPIWAMTSSWVAKVGHGHNGYIDTLITIGLPGLILAVAVLLVWPAIRLLCSLSIARSRRALLCAILTFCAGHNMTESTLFDRMNTVHVFMMIAIVLIHRLSDQSAGAHQALRERLLVLASRGGVARLRARLIGRTRRPQADTNWRREPLPAVASPIVASDQQAEAGPA